MRNEHDEMQEDGLTSVTSIIIFNLRLKARQVAWGKDRQQHKIAVGRVTFTGNMASKKLNDLHNIVYGLGIKLQGRQPSQGCTPCEHQGRAQSAIRQAPIQSPVCKSVLAPQTTASLNHSGRRKSAASCSSASNRSSLPSHPAQRPPRYPFSSSTYSRIILAIYTTI